MLAEVENLHPETRHHYASMLRAILDDAKAVRLIGSHQLESVYYTVLRPENNRCLDWEEITLDPVTMRGTFKLDQHKTVNKGIKARGPLAREMVE